MISRLLVPLLAAAALLAAAVPVAQATSTVSAGACVFGICEGVSEQVPADLPAERVEQCSPPVAPVAGACAVLVIVDIRSP